MRSSSRLAVAMVPLSLVLAASSAARADDATAFFAQGRSLRLEGKCAEAVPMFRKALEAKPDGIGALRNIAECEEELGRFASARADYWRLRTAALEADANKYPDWNVYAETRYKALEPKVARMTVRLSGANLDVVRVTIDGQPLHPDLVGTELERDPGQHVIEATYGGVSPLRVEKKLTPGTREVVTLTIPGDAQKVPASGDVPKTTTGPSPLRTAGFVVLGVGVASAAAMVASIVVRASAQSSVEQSCPNGACPSQDVLNSTQDALNRGKLTSTLVNVFLPLTIAGVGAGVTLITIGSLASTPPKPGAPAAAASARGVQLAFAPSIGGAGLRVEGRF